MQYIRFPNQTVILSGQVDSWTFDYLGNGITSTDLGGGIRGLDVNLAGGSVVVGGVGTVGDPVPAEALQVGFEDPSGDLANAKVTAGGELLISSSTLATEATLSALNTKVPSQGQALMAASVPVAIASNQSALPISAASLPLPTGAATEATLSALNGKVTACNTGSVTVVASALPTGAATETTLSAMSAKLPATLGQKAMADSLAVVLASDQSAIPVTSGANTAGNSPGSGTVSTVTTLTAPANAVGFILMCLDTATANIRYRIGAAATTSSGQQLQAGRDTGYIPCGANVSICAESGTQPYDIQWVLSS